MTAALAHGELLERAKSALSATDTIRGVAVKGRLELFTTEGSRFFWSPQLTVDIEEKDGELALHGRFGPHPNIWTLYVAIHGVGAVTTLAAAIYGLSQHLSGQTPWALWALPAAPILALLVWALAFVGQSMGYEQMNQLRGFFDELLEPS